VARLREIGFAQVTVLPSELLGDRGDFWHRYYFKLCQLLWGISDGERVLTPSMLVVASRRATQ
jgi:hypothetical protein